MLIIIHKKIKGAIYTISLIHDSILYTWKNRRVVYPQVFDTCEYGQDWSSD